MKGAAAARETSVPRSGVDLVARLLQRCVLEASSVIPTGSRLALLGFPNHADPGAASTWLGELELAKRIRATVVYAAHHESYRADTLLASEPDFVVLHGGGNSIGAPPDFSCLLRGLSGIPVVQLSSRYPWEPGGEALERLAESVERHGNVTIFAGCGQSFASLNWALPAGACRMAPDSALLCSIPPARGAPLREVIWLSRRDGESVRRERVPTRRGLLRAD